MLAEEALELAEVTLRIAAEARTQNAAVAALVELGAQGAPLPSVGARQVSRVGRAQAGRCGGQEAHRSAQHHRRRGGLSPGGAPVVMAVRTEELLKTVVGARQIGDGIAVEQRRAVAARDLAEVCDGPGQPPGLALVADHGANQAVQAPAYGAGIEASLVAQDVRRLMDPAISNLHGRPERGRARQSSSDQVVQSPQLGIYRPFFATRSRLAATAPRRSLSLSPEAASGGRPSSVRALRTAAQ